MDKSSFFWGNGGQNKDIFSPAHVGTGICLWGGAGLTYILPTGKCKYIKKRQYGFNYFIYFKQFNL